MEHRRAAEKMDLSIGGAGGRKVDDPEICRQGGIGSRLRGAVRDSHGHGQGDAHDDEGDSSH